MCPNEAAKKSREYHKMPHLALLILLSMLVACAGGKPVKVPPIQQMDYGKVLLPDGARYEGGIVDGLLEGRGKLFWPNGSHYIGEFHRGLMAGKGEYLTVAGDVYQGTFLNGMITGRGVYRFANGDRYQGEFSQGAFNGKGTLIRKNGDRYAGDFHNNLYDGMGTYHFAHPRGGRKQLSGKWRHGHFAGKQNSQDTLIDKAATDPLIPEFILFRQYRLLSRAVSRVRPSRLGVPDLYFIAFAADGHQDVFMKEAIYTKHLFEQQYGTKGRALLLVNNHRLVKEVPLASAVNLQKALNAIAHKMNKDEDILFLFLTSHGSRDHRLAVSLGRLPLEQISVPLLAGLLAKTPIKWKVIVISACYSGGFIDALQSDTTLVITSARADRTSFGCSDDVDMTYFGRAFFQRALSGSSSFIDAFYRARKLLTHWENEDEYDHSDPQISVGKLMKKKLRTWRASLAHLEDEAAKRNASGLPGAAGKQ